VAKDSLNAKQEAFVREYLIDSNGTQAAIRAGYSAKTAYSIGNENLKKPEIVKAIEEGRAKLAEKVDIAKEDITARLDEIALRCMRHEQVLDNKGMPTGEYKFDASGAIKANVELAKMLGYAVPDKVDLTLVQKALIGVDPADI
jgi:phage terminase small subunit